MSDQSHLDERYFVDEYVYNCPFCNRRHVSYSIYKKESFDWVQNKECYVYFVCCHSCNGRSMHLTFERLDTDYIFHGMDTTWRFAFPDDENIPELIDDLFFYSVPTSFFVLDQRIPKILRELLTEAEGCLKSNFLTGASACARKIVYEMTSTEKFDGNYEDRIKSLKQKYPEVEQTYFDTLLTIQQLTSSKVHENSYDGWNSGHLQLILASLRKMLHEIYVVPALREDDRKSILKLKKELLGKNVSSPEFGDDEAAT